MTNIFKYVIADFPVEIETSLDSSPFSRLGGFNLFSAGSGSFAQNETTDVVLRYSTCGHLADMEEALQYTLTHKALHEFDFEDQDIRCFFYNTDSQYIFKMIPQEGEIHLFVSDGGNRIVSNWEENKNLSMLRFSLWIAFAIAIAPRGAFPIHSSVIVYKGNAILFLGESGTGKSTHTRLWREHIPESFLLNDDSPILRVEEGKVNAYGSPWSGKTPCFRDEHYPVAAFVRLSQAPHNEIRRLSKISSFGALYPSCPPAFAFDEILSDNICDTLSQIISTTPVFHLECLPDREAALLSSSVVFNKTSINE